MADDFTRELGNQLEGRLAAALFYRANQQCQGPASGLGDRSQIQAATMGGDEEGVMLKNPLRENRLILQ